MSIVIFILLLSAIETHCSDLTANYSDDTTKRSVIIIRHGKPKLAKEGWYSFEEARDYSFQYDTVSVDSIAHLSIDIESISTDTIYCSSLQRARNTAQQLFSGKNKVIIDSKLFREFEREVPAIPIIQMPLNVWLIISRLNWMLSLQSPSIEGFKSANYRVQMAADFIELNLISNKQFVLVAHGLFNAKLIKELKRRGYAISKDGGRSYLATWVLIK